MASAPNVPEIPGGETEQDRDFTTPDMVWEGDALGPSCSLSIDDQKLFNHTKKLRPGPTRPYSFPGTRGTRALTVEDVVYWEVSWLVPKHGTFKPGVPRLVEMGAATEEALRACTGEEAVAKLNKAAITVGIGVDLEEKEYELWGVRGPVELDPERLASDFDPNQDIGSRVGFLFDGPNSTMYVTKVSEFTILWTSEIDVSQPLWPFVRVASMETAGKEIIVHLKSGTGIKMDDKKRKLLLDMVRGDAVRHKIVPFMT